MLVDKAAQYHPKWSLSFSTDTLPAEDTPRCATCLSVQNSLKSQVVSLQTAHSWANAGVLLGDACIGSGVAFEAI